jgi:glycosyltransferase involved in cell wall biosynthesis
MLFLTKPVSPKIIRVANKKGIKTGTLATVAHPLFNKDIVERIYKRYSYYEKSNYIDLKRIKRVIETYKNSDFIILKTSSEFGLKSYLDYGIPGNKIISLKADPPVETDFFKPEMYSEKHSNNSLVFLTLGYLSSIKGIPVLLEAWYIFKSRNNNRASLHLAGPVSNDLKKTISRYDLDSLNIKLPGKVNRNRIAEIYNSADVFVASSVSDLAPDTVKEAMACGLPVVVSKNCGNAKYVVEGENGFTYDALDEKQLAEIFSWFLSNRTKINEMGVKSLQTINNVFKRNYYDELFSSLNAVKRNE